MTIEIKPVFYDLQSVEPSAVDGAKRIHFIFNTHFFFFFYSKSGPKCISGKIGEGIIRK